MWWRIGLAVVLVLWMVGVLLLGLVLNAFRIDEGPTVIVLDAARGWGLHRMDLRIIAVAVLPILISGLLAIVAQLLTPRPRRRRPERWSPVPDRHRG